MIAATLSRTLRHATLFLFLSALAAPLRMAQAQLLVNAIRDVVRGSTSAASPAANKH